MTIPLSQFFRLPEAPPPSELKAVLGPYGFRDPRKVWRLLSPLARDPSVKTDWAELVPLLLEGFRASADPDLAALHFSSFAEQVFHRPHLFQYLIRRPQARAVLCRVFGAAPSLSAVLVRRPNLLYWLIDEDGLNARFSPERFREEAAFELEASPGVESGLQILRRLRHREMLRVGARDLLGLADVKDLTRDLSDLADALIDLALELCRRALAEEGKPPPEGGRYVVLGMGKLGGRELNYSSDVDLLFLYEPPPGADEGARRRAHEYFNALSERLVKSLSEASSEGALFRVDLRLRPEGMGELAHSLEGYLSYYENRGDLWERQALLKARPCAGDRELGEDFLRRVEPLVFRKFLGSDVVAEIRSVMALIERKMASKGLGNLQVKLGRGGIREIEFIVQMLQLVHGGARPEVRSANTLEALEALREAGLLLAADAQFLAEGYRFLRNVEHRLQMVHQLQTHTLPRSVRDLRALARKLGFEDRPGESAAARFKARYREVTGRVRALFEEVFRIQRRRDPSARVVQATLEEDAESLKALLAGGTFVNPDRAAANLLVLSKRLRRTAGHKGEALWMKAAPRLLSGLGRTANPDRALNQFERFLRAASLPDLYVRWLLENGRVLSLLLDLFSDSEFLSETLVLNPGNLDVALRAASEKSPVSIREHLEPLEEHLGEIPDWEDRLDLLRDFRNTELLRIGVRDLLGRLDPFEAFAEMSRLAFALARAALRAAAERLDLPRLPGGAPKGFVMAAAGKLGGRELNYGSDLDVLFAYDDAVEEASGGFERLLDLARLFIEALSKPTRRGTAYEVDARLRPMGKEAPLVHSFTAYERYFRETAETWERLAYTRTVFLAGDHEAGYRFANLVSAFVYGRGLTRRELSEIREVRVAMEGKARGATGLEFKVSPGGIADVEFLVQALQLSHGRGNPVVRVPHLPTALENLREAGILPADVARDLLESYRLYRMVESRLRIVQEESVDELPEDPGRLSRLAQRLGRGKKRWSSEELVVRLEEARKKVRGLYDRMEEWVVFED